MKRQPLIFALALLLIVGAALWGVNYRLDHPPLTKADKEFHALVAGANGVTIEQMTPLYLHREIILNTEQTQELIQMLRFSDIPVEINSESPLYALNVTIITLNFRNNTKDLAQFGLFQTSKSSNFSSSSAPGDELYNLNPRSEKRLRRYLDRILLKATPSQPVGY